MSEQVSAIFSSTKESSVLATEPLMMRNVDARKDERGFLCAGDESLEEVMKRAPFSPGNQKAPDSTLASKLASVDSNYVLTWLATTAPPGPAAVETQEEDDSFNMYQSRPMSPSESSSSPRYAASPPNAGDEASCPHHQYGAGDENPRHPFFHRDHLDHLDQHSHAEHQEIYRRQENSHHHHHCSSAQSSQTVSTEDVGSLCSSPRQASTETSSEPSRDRLAFSPPETRRTLQRSTNQAGTGAGGSRPVITLSNGALKASSGSSPFREGCSCKPYKYTRAQSAGQGLTPAIDDENSPVRQKLTFV